MVLGDSFTEGQGVKEPDTYPRRLEALLNASGSGRWEVRNCGRRATDFPELYAAFEEILAFQPDVIVYGMVLNDADRSPEFQARQTYVNDWILDRGRILEGGADPALAPWTRASSRWCTTASRATGRRGPPCAGTARCTARPTAPAGSAPSSS